MTVLGGRGCGDFRVDGWGGEAPRLSSLDDLHSRGHGGEQQKPTTHTFAVQRQRSGAAGAATSGKMLVVMMWRQSSGMSVTMSWNVGITVENIYNPSIPVKLS